MDLQRALQDLINMRQNLISRLRQCVCRICWARLTAFSGSEHWVIAFEVLGFSIREGEFVNDLYAYGSCIEKEGFISSRTIITSMAEHPIFDSETNECIADWKSWSVAANNKIISFSPMRRNIWLQDLRFLLNLVLGHSKKYNYYAFWSTNSELPLSL